MSRSLKLFTIFLPCLMWTVLTLNVLPKVAILAVPSCTDVTKPCDTSEISPNYVRWLEASGAESVIVQPWHNEREIDDIFIQANGFLLQDYYNKEDKVYNKLVSYIADKVINMKDVIKQNIPLIAVGGGLSTLHSIRASEDVLKSAPISKKALSLEFDIDRILTSKLYSKLNLDDLFLLESNPSIYFHQNLTVSPEAYRRISNLRNFFRITSTVADNSKNYFVASVEAYHYPIYAVLYHPEKIIFEKNDKTNIPTSKEAIQTSRFIGNFFVSEARKNSNVMDDTEDKFKVIGEFAYPEYDAERNLYLFKFKKPE